ncbi:MAG: efflux RND transporter periplasmic adaptor subunit [Armatimonadota bacterium]
MAGRPDKRRRIPWWIIVVVVAAALLVYAVIPKPLTISTAHVREGVLSLPLSATGVVEGKVSDITSRLTARITGLFAEEGDTITRGQRLAQLETEDLQGEVTRLQATADAADQQVASLQQTAAAEADQLRAAEERAQANLQATRENLRQLQAGSRTEDIAAQRAVVAQARAQAEEARRNYERAQLLHAQGAIPTQRLDNARATYQTATAQVQAQEQVLRRLEAGPRSQEIAAAAAQVNAAEAAVREARAARGREAARQREVAAAQANAAAARAALQNARLQLSYTTITSPYAGVVVRKHKETGEMASPFEPIYSIANLTNIWVTAEVDEEDVAAVATGQPVAITLDAYPGRQASGTVTSVSQVAEPKEVGRVRAKVVRTRIKILRTTLPLRPGMEVNITGQLPTGATTLLVPNDAVIRVGDRDQVYVVQNGVVHLREVKVGQANFEVTQILSGLYAGNTVAVSNLDQLTDGARVRIAQ